jgi:cobalt-zinc-cadmium efflux system outer membrane protein
MLGATMHAFVLFCVINIGVGPTEAKPLDWQTVAELARQFAPNVRLAQARRAELDAQHRNIRAPSSGNPELALTGGPGFVNQDNTPALEFMLSLTWPVDISDSARARQSWADQHSLQADLELEDAGRLAVGYALDLFARSCGAEARVEVAQARAALDAELLRIARVRRDAGDVGDGDLALAQMMSAESDALLRIAQGDDQAILLQLAMQLGLPEVAPPHLCHAGWPMPKPLSALLDGLANRSDLRRAKVAKASAELDRTVQQRLGWPVPKVVIGGGRGPEYQGELGLTVPLPVYQRNQVNAAVAAAHVGTAQTEMALLQRAAAYELQAAYAQFESAQAAYALLQEAKSAIDDAEHLALRAFELGQDTLARAVVTRREVVFARAALQQANLDMTRARIALCVAAGTCSAEVVP